MPTRAVRIFATLILLGSAIASVSLARTAPLQVTYYYLPG
jgi:hypothetical protein